MKGEKPKPAWKKQKNDPALVAKARELRDRWLERVDREPELLMNQGKYDLRRWGADRKGALESDRRRLAA